MGIELTRIDYRLIHGQVITSWTRQLGINEIVTVDNSLSQDMFMQEVFKMAAPKGVKIKIYSTKEAVEKQQNGDFEKSKILLLFKTVSEIYTAVNEGLEIKEIQVGGLGGGPGRKAVHNAITLDQKDSDMLVELEKKGINIYLQTTPDYLKETLKNAIAKL
ncbi:MAG TPA: PTS sugar transporter subunit IIB [Facklamia tabacinasalis]|nr:PTS sugar transporter subunit IIB [Ruoffia tabacinasalis]